MKRSHILFTIICLISIYALCVWTRIGIRLSAEKKFTELPFTMEGAFLFHFSNLIAEDKTIPLIDFKAQNPEGFQADRKISLTIDYLLGFVYRKFFTQISYSSFLRIAQPSFVCLSIFITSWIVYRLSKNALGSIWAALIYGLSMSSILRSTGIEYSRENFALPFLFFHFGLCLMPKNILREGLAALSLTLSCMIWDGTQIYFMLWILWEILSFLFQKNKSPQSMVHGPELEKAFNLKVSFSRGLSTVDYRLFIHLLFLTPTALIHPYLQDHHFIYSPGMMGLYALCLSSVFREKWRKPIFIFLVPVTVFLWTLSPYLGIYEHMLQLALYKIKFLNTKPLDPALLPFDVRLLWTPALHSAPLQNLKTLLPFIILSIPATLSHFKSRKDSIFFLLFSYILSLILFIAFVRLEVFLIFFLSCLVGSAPMGACLKRIKQTLFWNSCIILALLTEAENITKDFSRFERPVLYPHLEGVTTWIRERTPRQSIILANFGLSPSFLAYAQRGIILHPKYESKDMRKKIKEFTETLFENSEPPFYSYCLKNEADYYVHTLGTFQDRSSYSWSYMADRLNPLKESLAERFEYGLPLKRFHWVHDEGKYRIYRVIKPKQIHRARLFRHQGDRFLEKGLFEEAKQKYEEAFKLNPNDPQVYFSLARFFNKTGASEKAIQATKEGLKRISDLGFWIADRTEKGDKGQIQNKKFFESEIRNSQSAI